MSAGGDAVPVQPTPLTPELLELCRDARVRITRSRAVVLRIIAGAEEPIDVHSLVRFSRRMGDPPVRTSIYRAVRDLTAKGILIELGGRDRRRRYAIAEPMVMTLRLEGQPHRVRLNAPDLGERILQEARRLGLEVCGRQISIALVGQMAAGKHPRPS